MWERPCRGRWRRGPMPIALHWAAVRRGGGGVGGILALSTVAVWARMLNFIRHNRMRRTQVSDHGRLVRPRWIHLEARAGAEQPTSRDSADGSVQQPAVTASRVEQPATLSKCWLCASTHSIDELRTLQTCHLPAPVLQCLVDRYSRTAMPLICSACQLFISTAVRHAAQASASEVGQKLLHCAEAFAARDYQGRPVDSLGQWHQGVAMQRTCRWEPWCGTTAQATETAVAECTGQPEKQLHRIFETYRVALPGSRKRTRAEQPVRLSEQRRISTPDPAAHINHAPQSKASAAQPGPPRGTAIVPSAAPSTNVVQPGSAAASAQAPVTGKVVQTTTTGPSVAQPGPSRTLQHLCTNYQITAFSRPFYLLMIMKLLPVRWGEHAELLLRTSWSTAWGGGKIINALLFNGERIVPESALDARRNARDQCYYQSCKANEVFACILLHSEFGDRLLQIGCENIPPEMRRPIFHLQRFCYKLCELRKGNQSRRYVYYKLFHTVPARRKWLERRHDNGEVVVTPLW